jgi:hypothetical protein
MRIPMDQALRDGLRGQGIFPGAGGNYSGTNLPDYLTRTPGGRFSFNEGTTNRQVVDTMQSLGLLNDKDYNWFLKWFSESAEQGNDLANSSSFLNQAGSLDFSNSDFNSDSMRRVGLLSSFLNDEYAETGSFASNNSFTETYGFGAAAGPQVSVGRDAEGGLLPSRPTDAAQANALQDVFVAPSKVSESNVFVDPGTMPLREGDEKTYVEEPPPPPPKDPAPMLPPGPDTPPTVTAPPSTPNLGFAGGLFPGFGNFSSFMNKADKGTNDFFDSEEIEKEINRRAFNQSSEFSLNQPASGTDLLPSTFSGGFMGISPAAIQQAINDYRVSQGIQDETSLEEPVEMQTGGEVGEGIASLMAVDNSPASGEGIESFLMKYESPDVFMVDRKKATLKRTLQRLQQEQMQQQMPPQGPSPTAPGPMPTMQQGIMPMAN